MKTLTRYVVRNFLTSVLLVFVVIISLRVVSDLFFNMDEFTKKRADEQSKSFVMVAHEIGSYYGYRSLVYFRELGPVMIVVAAAFTLARMNHTNELTAMLASGVSLHRVLAPIVLAAVGLNVLIVLDNELVIPPVKDKLIRRRDEIAGMKPVEVRLVTDSRRSSWYSTALHPRTGVVVNPLIALRDDRYAALGFITGPRARYDAARDGWAFVPQPSERQTGRIDHPRIHPVEKDQEIASTSLVCSTEFARTVLSPPQIIRNIQAKPEYAEMPVDWEKVRLIRNLRMDDAARKMVLRAERVVFRTPGDPTSMVLENMRMEFFPAEGAASVVLSAKAAEWKRQEETKGDYGWKLTDGEMIYRSDMTPVDLALRQKSDWMQYMSSAELARLVRLRNAVDPERAMLTRHARFADFFNGLIMLMMAAPFILSRERNLKTSAGLALLTVAGVMVFIYMSRYMGLPPMVAVWLPILVFGPVAVLMVDSIKT